MIKGTRSMHITRVLGLLVALIVLMVAVPGNAVTGGVINAPAATGPGSWTYTTTVTSAASPYTAKDGEWVWVDASGGAVTINTPAASGTPRIRVTKSDSTGNLVTIVPSSGTIGGAGLSSITCGTQDQMLELNWDGTRWRLG